MNHRPTIVGARWRRLARNLACVGVVISGVGMFGEVTQALPAGTPPAGSMTLVPATGDSATTFRLNFDTPPSPQFCPGDNTAGFLYHTFITPASNDPADFVWSSSGSPQGEPAFTTNLADSLATRRRNVLPGLGDGLLIEQTGLTFSNTFYSALTPGDYRVGVACTQPDAGFVVQTMKFWMGTVTITASPGAGPNNFTYAMVGAPTDSTTTSTTTTSTTSTTAPPGGTTTTTTSVGATTTTPGGTTTTTIVCPTASTTTTSVAGATTTTIVGATTSTTNPCPTTTTAPSGASAGVTATTVRFGSGSGSSSGSGSGAQTAGTGGSAQNLADTGPSSTPAILMWAGLMLLFGRMLVLMARPIRVSRDRS